MTSDFESKIVELIQNRHRNKESSATRHIHIRFGNDFEEIEKILEKLLEKKQISKYYDVQYQEYRYTPKNSVKE